MSPEELAATYFRGRMEFCRREGIEITPELLATHVTGAILVGVKEERERCLAKVAEERERQWDGHFKVTDGVAGCDWIADAIRTGK